MDRRVHQGQSELILTLLLITGVLILGALLYSYRAGTASVGNKLKDDIIKHIQLVKDLRRRRADDAAAKLRDDWSRD